MDTTTQPTAPQFPPELEARIRAHEAKRAARIARLERSADRADERSRSAFSRADQMASCIPMGQPILVGHHSERADRRFRDRIWRLMGRGVSENNLANHLRTRAEAAAGNDAITSDDPLADRKLAAKIEEAERLQERMKAANLAIRKHAKAGPDAQAAALVALGFDQIQARKLLAPDFCGRIGFADYQLTNNGANIRRMKKRLARVVVDQATPSSELEGANGIRLEDSPQDNRVRLYFPGKPADALRAQLKSRGFRWSPTIGAWQAYRNAWTMQTARELAGLTTENAA